MRLGEVWGVAAQLEEIDSIGRDYLPKTSPSCVAIVV